MAKKGNTARTTLYLLENGGGGCPKKCCDEGLFPPSNEESNDARVQIWEPRKHAGEVVVLFVPLSKLKRHNGPTSSGHLRAPVCGYRPRLIFYSAGLLVESVTGHGTRSMFASSSEICTCSFQTFELDTRSIISV